MVKGGDRYWAVTNTLPDGTQEGHFFFVLLDPFGPDNTTLIVPHCTIRSRTHDPTCVLRAERYKFLTSDSCVDFKFAETRSAKDIDEEIAEGRARVIDTISPDLLDTVRDGVLVSPFTKRRIKDWYREYRLDHAASASPP